MSKKTLLASLSILAGLVFALVAAFWFRESVLVIATNHFLAGKVTVSGLHGLHFDSRHASVDELALTLQSGQQLLVAGFEVNFTFPKKFSAPVVQALTIATAQLHNPAEPVHRATNVSTSLSDILQLLREFPVAVIEIKSLAVPQRREALVAKLEHSTGKLDLNIHSGNLLLLANFTQTDATAPALVQITFTSNDETVLGFQLSLQAAAAAFALTGKGHLAFADLNLLLGELEQQPLKLPLKSAKLDWELAGTVADNISGASNAAPATFVLGMQAGSTIALPSEADSALGELTLLLNNKAALSFTTGADSGISSGTLPLHMASSWQQKAFTVDTLLTFARTGVANEYQVQTRELAVRGLSSWTPAVDFNARVTLGEDKLSFATPLLLRDAPADAGITLTGSYDLATGAAEVHAKVPPIEFTDKTRPLSVWLSGWPYAFDLLGGSLAADIDLQWQAGTKSASAIMTAKVVATLKDLAGLYDTILFRGLNSELKGSIDGKDMFRIETPPLILIADSVDFGMPVNKVTASFRFDRDTQRLLLDYIRGDALGGKVYGDELSYDFSRERNDVRLQFSGLRLEQALAMANYDAVKASGAVSGELPLTLTKDGVEVAKGTLHADAPGGSIHYQAAAGVQGNAGMDLVNQALSNYQFDSLISGIDYSKTGELMLSLHLQGQNPDMNEGQRINLNLNLSDNIPALLKSLQATRVIEDFLQKKYQ